MRLGATTNTRLSRTWWKIKQISVLGVRILVFFDQNPQTLSRQPSWPPGTGEKDRKHWKHRDPVFSFRLDFSWLNRFMRWTSKQCISEIRKSCALKFLMRDGRYWCFWFQCKRRKIFESRCGIWLASLCFLLYWNLTSDSYEIRCRKKTKIDIRSQPQKKHQKPS